MIDLPHTTKFPRDTFLLQMFSNSPYLRKLDSVLDFLVQKCRDDFERNSEPNWSGDNEDFLESCRIRVL